MTSAFLGFCFFFFRQKLFTPLAVFLAEILRCAMILLLIGIDLGAGVLVCLSQEKDHLRQDLSPFFIAVIIDLVAKLLGGGVVLVHRFESVILHAFLLQYGGKANAVIFDGLQHIGERIQEPIAYAIRVKVAVALRRPLPRPLDASKKISNRSDVCKNRVHT